MHSVSKFIPRSLFSASDFATAVLRDNHNSYNNNNYINMSINYINCDNVTGQIWHDTNSYSIYFTENLLTRMQKIYYYIHLRVLLSMLDVVRRSCVSLLGV